MKIRYFFFIVVLLFGAVIYGYQVLSSPSKLHPNIGDLLQGIAIFVALLASVIALSSADHKRKAVKVNITAHVEKKYTEQYSKSDFSPQLKDIYSAYPDPVVSHRVYFDMRNISGFTLKRPTLTFRLPINKKHPQKDAINYGSTTFHSNLFNYQRDLVTLETGDTLILSNNNLPYWNNDDDIGIWIRMVLDPGPPEPFPVEISVNCENAEGITKSIKIDMGKGI
jgi:hypothetical protein